MTKTIQEKLISEVNKASEAFSINDDASYTALLENIGDARFVMLGEASHGTEEFYQARIEITKRLITEKGFMGVAIEGDWPDAHQVHRYIQGEEPKVDAKAVLNQFTRFPTWMWRNTVMPPFLEWLRNQNKQYSSPSQKLGFYGLDLYSMNASMQAVVDYLKQVDPDAAQRTIQHYTCFDHMQRDPQAYGYLAAAGIKKNCIDEVISVLYALQQHDFDYKYLMKPESISEDAYFSAIQNARLVKNAETYYRSLFMDNVSSWNVRDKHMAETLDVLVEQLEEQSGKPAKLIVWAHNSHLGDARATEMGSRGEVNLGQLMREKYTDTYNIGFSTYDGYVTAASDWDAPAEQKRINPGLRGSYEDLFHQAQLKSFSLTFKANKTLEHLLKIQRLQRAIGVIYRPETERVSHYFLTNLPHQFNSILHFDRTSALRPIDPNAEWIT